VVQAPVGLVVMSARCIRRVSTSMQDNTWNRRKGDGVNAEEVCRDQGLGLGSDELVPARSGAIRCRFATGLPQDLPYGGSCDAVPEPAYFTMNTPVPPVRVFAVETQDELTKLSRCWRPSGLGLWWLGPATGDEAPVPADHGGWFHDQRDLAQSSVTGCPRQHGQDGPVGGREPRPLDLSLLHQDLVAKSENFCVALIARHQQQSETSDQQPEQVRKDRRHNQ